MKRIVFFSLLVALFATQAQAQISVGGTFGLALPAGDFADGANTGIGGQAVVKYNITDRYTLGVSYAYYNFGTELDEMTFSIAPLVATFEASWGEAKLKPFAAIDLGMYTLGVKLDVGSVEHSTSDNYFGMAPSIGFNHELTDNLILTSNMKYHFIFGKDDADEASTTSFFGVNVGLLYRF